MHGELIMKYSLAQCYSKVEQHQPHPETCKKCRLSGFTDLLRQTFWETTQQSKFQQVFHVTLIHLTKDLTALLYTLSPFSVVTALKTSSRTVQNSLRKVSLYTLLNLQHDTVQEQGECKFSLHSLVSVTSQIVS